MKIERFGTASMVAITALEKKYQVKLPEAYRSFLNANNGGIVSKDPPVSLPIPGTNESVDLDILYGIGMTEEVFDLDYWMGRYADEIPQGAFIIGDDTMKGFLMLLDVDGDTRLCYWDDKRNLSVSTDESNAYLLEMDCESLFDIHTGKAAQQMQNLLPLGSIVLLEGGVQKLMIISRALRVAHGGNTFFFDYGGVPYPDGLTGDQMAYFQRENISRVVFEGFRDDDDLNLVEAIEKYISTTPDLLRGSPEAWSEDERKS